MIDKVEFIVNIQLFFTAWRKVCADVIDSAQIINVSVYESGLLFLSSECDDVFVLSRIPIQAITTGNVTLGADAIKWPACLNGKYKVAVYDQTILMEEICR